MLGLYLGKSALSAKSITLLDVVQLKYTHFHTHKVAIDDQVCFSKWWILSINQTWSCETVQKCGIRPCVCFFTS